MATTICAIDNQLLNSPNTNLFLYTSIRYAMQARAVVRKTKTKAKQNIFFTKITQNKILKNEKKYIKKEEVEVRNVYRMPTATQQPQRKQMEHGIKSMKQSPNQFFFYY